MTTEIADQGGAGSRAHPVPWRNATEFTSIVSAITSAFGDATRRQIYLFAHDRDDGVTATEVAQHFDLHPNVARHHLDKLSAGGYLQAHAHRNSGGAGRPSKRYQVVTHQENFELPVRHDDVIMALLVRSLDKLGPLAAAELAEGVGQEFGEAMATAMTGPTAATTAQRSVESALHAVADAMSAHGFASHSGVEDGRLRIVNDHCPFGEIALDNPVLCALDRGMVQGMLRSLYGETPVDLSSSKPQGDAICASTVGQ